MIVLWGVPGDPPLAAVRRAIEKHRRACVLIDQNTPQDAQMELTVNSKVDGWLKVGKKKVDLEKVDGVYLRPYGPVEPPAVEKAGPGSAAWRHAIALHEAMLHWIEVAAALVVNPISVMGSNASKPYQARLIRAAGFRVPDTLLTTDPAAVLEFRKRHGQVIYKSVSGLRSVVSRLTDDKLERIDAVRRCPTQFQEYVAGVDHRVHVIGDDVFACTIEHDADDYRFAGAAGRRVEKKAVDLDAGDAERLVKLVRSLELQVAGIDLRRTPEGEWVCFEVNPSPAFTYYETTPGLMAERIAKLLERRNA